MARLKCPECETTLNPAKPLAPGKKVRCPRCEAVFTVPADDDEQEAPSRKQAPAKASAVKKGAPAKDKPESRPSPKPAAADDADDEAGVYGFKLSEEEDQEEEEKKPKIDYAPNLTVTDPRGPATAKLIAPSNWIIVHGAELFFGGLLVFAIGLWPFVFAEFLVPPKEFYRAGKIEEKRKQQEEARKRQPGGAAAGGSSTQTSEQEEYVDDIKPEELEKTYPKYYTAWEKACEEKAGENSWMMVAGVLAALYGLLVGYGGVKMQNLESYPWSIAAAIMVVVAGLGLGGTGLFYLIEGKSGVKFATAISSGVFFGGWALARLKEPKIRDAFFFKPK
jgi:hypothetical protein